MIKIIDNFFSENDLKFIQDFALTKAFYTPCFFPDTIEKNKQNHYGNRWVLENKPELLELFKKQSELKFKIKINNINPTSGIDQRIYDALLHRQLVDCYKILCSVEGEKIRRC